MDIGKIEEEAKKVIDERGGMDSVKDDALEVKDIVGKDESLTDKAKDTFEALKDPGAPGDETKPAS